MDKGLFTFLALLLLSGYSAIGQNIADTVRLKEISILAEAEDKKVIPGNIYEDRAISGLATLLDAYTGIAVKSYGEGSPSTLSFRGTTASHTQLVWNGIPLNLPSLGQSDFSNIPALFSDNISMLPGSPSLIYGSGSFGGNIILENNASWDDRLNVKYIQDAGSFHTSGGYFRLAAGNSRVHSVSRLFYQQSRMDFPYVNTDKAGNPAERRENADYGRYGGQQELYFRTDNHHYFKGILWLQKSRHNIPPTTVQEFHGNKEHQDDFAMRGMLSWQYIQKGRKWDVKAGWVHDDMHYDNDESNLHTRNISDSRIVGAGLITSLASFAGLRVNWDNTYQTAVSESLGNTKSRMISSMLATLELILARGLEVELMLRGEYAGKSFSPLMPGMELKINPWEKSGLVLKGSLARNYRLPSLNDLYWQFDGYAKGNPDLLPEKGITSDLGLDWTYGGQDNIMVNAGFTGFINSIQNMIQWTPSQAGIWAPENVAQNLARGLESRLIISFTNKNIGAGIESNYSYTISTREGENDPLEGMQLIYIPKHKANGRAYLSAFGAEAGYHLQFTGIRYTVADNSRYLPSYILQDVYINKSMSFKNFRIKMELRVNNLADVSYQSVVRQPMPGRNFYISLILEYGQKQSTH
ncbi:MAG: TonB-dependent receptor [Bacteroidetes bacterium]|nr:TonB-dependent receptor [Bacteroidota bacterium]